MWTGPAARIAVPDAQGYGLQRTISARRVRGMKTAVPMGRRHLFLLLTLLVARTVFGQDVDSTRLAKAEKALIAGKCKEVDQHLAPLLERTPPAPKAIVLRARCLIYREKRTEDGLAVLSKGTAVQPESSVLLRARGDVYNDLRMFERAEEDLRLAVKHATSDEERMSALNSRSWNMLSMRKFNEALELAQEAVALDTTNVRASNNVGLAAMELGDTALAVATLQRNVRLDPEGTVGWMNLGFVLAGSGRHQEALEAYAKAEDLDADHASLLNNIGYSHLQQGDRRMARSYMERSMRKDPYNSYVYRNLALLELQEGNVEKACTAMERALSLGFTKTYGNEVNELRSEHCR
jgi:Flp pilus assembly protein TadD